MMTWLVVTYVWLLLYTNFDIMSTSGGLVLGLGEDDTAGA
jgi:hypothetical protein